MSESVLRPHGQAEWADRESDRMVVRDVIQCAHCGMHFFAASPRGTLKLLADGLRVLGDGKGLTAFLARP